MNENKEIEKLELKLIKLHKEEKEEVKSGNMKEEDTILQLINTTKEILYEYEVSKLAREAASYFIIGILISFILFMVMWYLSVDNGILNGYFYNLFCNTEEEKGSQ